MSRPKSRKRLWRISEVAARLDMHPQTLRLYERHGLIAPRRSRGNMRYFDEADLERLEVIRTLARELGVNLAGIEVILGMRARLGELQAEVQRLSVMLEAELLRAGAASSAGALVRLPSRDVLRARGRGV